MSGANSPLIAVRDVQGAGRGVVARCPISPTVKILSTAEKGPKAHVVFRQYRREVCAFCFLYDRGRTLPVRDNDSGKVFCCAECEGRWTNSQGPLGLEAFRAVETFVKTRSKAITNVYGEEAVGEKPGREAIDGTWEEASLIAGLHRLARASAGTNSGPGIRAEKEYRKALHHVWTQPVDPDILAFLLSGLLSYHEAPSQWHEQVGGLAQDSQPYRTNAELEAHCNAFLQLIAILPAVLLPDLTIQLCHQLVAATSHNSFGLRSGGEDGEEYLGYALFPEASYFNHSCTPNVRKRRSGRRWEFNAGKACAAGEELCITYLGGDEESLGVQERRRRLSTTWGFECQCTRCCEEALQC